MNQTVVYFLMSGTDTTQKGESPQLTNQDSFSQYTNTRHLLFHQGLFPSNKKYLPAEQQPYICW